MMAKDGAVNLDLPVAAAAQEAPELLVFDGHEYWVFYPSDNPYRMLAAMPRRSDGTVEVPPDLLAKVRGWWYDKTAEQIDALAASAGIDWEACRLTDAEIDNGNVAEFTKKLNRIAGHIVWVSTQLMRTEAVLEAAKQALEQATLRRLALEANGEAQRPKGSQAMRLALYVSSDRTLRRTKIEIIELTAQRIALLHLREALDVLWRTTSRAISARVAEPLER